MIAAERPIWFGLFVPAKTPRAIVERPCREILKALQQPAVKDKLAGMGVDPMRITSRDVSMARNAWRFAASPDHSRSRLGHSKSHQSPFFLMCGNASPTGPEQKSTRAKIFTS
jgi:Tripartite tricarboxylate transporter family receptor